MHANEDIMFTVLHIYKYQYKWGTKNINDWSPYLASNLTPNYAPKLHMSVCLLVISRVCWPSQIQTVYIYNTDDRSRRDWYTQWCTQSTASFFSGSLILKRVPRRKWVPRESHMSPTRNRAIYWCKKFLYRQNVIKYIHYLKKLYNYTLCVNKSKF